MPNPLEQLKGTRTNLEMARQMQSPEYKPTPITESVKPFVQALATAKSKVGGVLRDQPISPIPGSPKWGTVQDYVKSAAPKTKEEAAAQGAVMIGDTPFDITGMGAGAITKKVATDVAGVAKPLVKQGVQEVVERARPVLADVFQGFTDLSTKILEKLKGKKTVSKQFISDLTNSPDLKQTERDVIREALTGADDVVDVPAFAGKVKTELLPLERVSVSPRYENINLPPELRGKVGGYSEHIYESPIKTSAGGIHFGRSQYQERQGGGGYFGHTRVEDLPSKKWLETPNKASLGIEELYAGDTRRVIEVQSDLYQKGNLEREGKMGGEFSEFNRLVEKKKYFEGLIENPPKIEIDYNPNFVKETKTELDIVNRNLKKYEAEHKTRRLELSKLQQYNDPTAHFRMIREEVKKAAQDGKTKLQFPTGETAMKIEGLGDNTQWEMRLGTRNGTPEYGRPTPNDLKVGKIILQGDQEWVITRVDGDGKFQAIQNNIFERVAEDSGKYPFPDDAIRALEKDTFPRSDLQSDVESFDISGKVDQNNPIYKFYEKEVGRYLKNKYGAQLVTDAQGVTWWEVPVSKEQTNLPVEAFAGVAGIGAASQTGDKKEDRSPAALLRGYLNKNNSMRDMLMQSTGQKKQEQRILDANSNLLPPAPDSTPDSGFIRGQQPPSPLQKPDSQLDRDKTFGAITGHESRGMENQTASISAVARGTGAIGISQITESMFDQWQIWGGDPKIKFEDLKGNQELQTRVTRESIEKLEAKYANGLDDYTASTPKLQKDKEEIKRDFNHPIYWMAGEWVAGPNWVSKLDNPTAWKIDKNGKKVPATKETVRDYMNAVGKRYFR